MRAGRAIVLIDGVDELAEARRADVRHWLTDLIVSFPNARYVAAGRDATGLAGAGRRPSQWRRSNR